MIEMLQNPPSDEKIRNIQKLIFEVHGFSQVKNRFRNTMEEYGTFENPMLNYIENQELLFYSNPTINLPVNFLKFTYK